MFATASEIQNKCEKIMKEEGNEGDEESAKLWNFRELCSWKLPEHLSTTGVKSLNRLNNRIHTDANL